MQPNKGRRRQVETYSIRKAKQGVVEGSPFGMVVYPSACFSLGRESPSLTLKVTTELTSKGIALYPQKPPRAEFSSQKKSTGQRPMDEEKATSVGMIHDRLQITI